MNEMPRKAIRRGEAAIKLQAGMPGSVRTFV